MTDAQYAEFEEWWASTEFLEKSAKGKTIRSSSSQSSNSTGAASATYAGGSVSITEHRERMVKLFPTVNSNSTYLLCEKINVSTFPM